MAKNPSFISIDINGYEKGPNRFGVDVYVWQIFNNGIKPTGAPGTSCLHGGGVDYHGCCVPTNYRTYNGHDAIINGFTCTYKALNDPSYFKKIKYLK